MLCAWEHDCPEKEKKQGDMIMFFNFIKIVMLSGVLILSTFYGSRGQNGTLYVGVLGIALMCIVFY